MGNVEDLLRATADRAARYVRDLGDRPVYPAFDPDSVYRRLGGPVPDHSEDPAVTVEALSDAVEPNLVSVAGGRYFGFVTGGALPATVAAQWLAAAWDQNAFSHVSSPAAAVFEETALRWIRESLALPPLLGQGAMDSGGSPAPLVSRT